MAKSKRHFPYRLDKRWSALFLALGVDDDDGVDVTADAYPYLAWQSTPRVLVPNKRYTDSASVRRGR